MAPTTGRKCWSCDAEQGAAARFCSVCGARLSPQPAGRREAEQAAFERTVERRQLTVVFCDLVGSTRLSLHLDPEDYTSIVKAYRDTCVSIIRHWNGYVARYVGDGLLIYFGYPKASEDDPLRAVSAAWQLAREIAAIRVSDLGLTADAIAEMPLQARVGIHTGLALVGEIAGRESTEIDAVSGAAPNIAAKLQALARPGEVIISEATARLLPALIQTVPVGEEAARANATNINAFVVTACPQTALPRRPITSDRFVGRVDLMSRVLSMLANVDQQSVKYLFVGEPGIGKSRFVHEVIRHPIASRILWIELACHPHGQSSPLYPFRQLLSEAEGDASRDVIEAGPLAGQASAALSPFQRRRKTFEHLKSVMRSRAPQLGIVLEDVHWADPTTQEFIGEVMSGSDGTKLHWLMTSRNMPEGEIGRSSSLCVEILNRLLPGEAADLAKASSGPRPLSAFELAEVVDRAGGIPLYVEEFVRAVSDRNPAAAESREKQIPATLRDSLMSRLDALGMGRSVALQASVLGRHFLYDDLLALLELDERELVASLHALANAGILLQSGVIPDASFEFRHTLLRDIAYHTLLKSDRERLHRRVANLASAGMIGEVGHLPELLAIHHSLGGNPKESVGFWLKAGQEAIKRSANHEALEQLSKGLQDCEALAKLNPGEAEQAELALLTALPAALIAVSGWSSPELERTYARATELSTKLGSHEAKFHLERGRYNLHLLRSELSEADEIADRLIGAARQTSDAATRKANLLEALRTKALVDFYRAHHVRARELLDQMMDLYDPAEHAGHAYLYGAEPAAVALSYLAWMDSVSGKLGSSRDRLERALDQANTVGHAFSICYVHCFAASCAQLEGDPRRVAEAADQAIRLANRNNFQYWLAWGRALRGWVQGLEAPQQGIAAIDAAQSAYLATGSTLVAPYFGALACNIARLKAGGLQEREHVLEHDANTTGVRFWLAALHVEPGTPPS
jgi:class 3 adenylate cyclase